MDAYSTTFRHMIIDQVASRMAIEQQAGCPRGLTNRPFESITAELMGARWDDLCAGPGTMEQLVARMCGTEKRLHEWQPEGRRTFSMRSGHRRGRR